MKKINRKKSLIILFLVLITFAVLQINGKSKYLYNDLPEVKLKETKDIKSKKSLAIMVTNDNGKGYKEYESDTWPSSEYKYKEAKCMNNKGEVVENSISFNEKNGKITLTTNETIYCTLYFEKSIITYLRINDKNNNLSSSIQGDMYRYQGTTKMVDNNYICFGTNSQDECRNNEDKYMYRIIGITSDDELKLIKETFLKEDNNRGFSWNNKYSTDSTNQYYCDNRQCPDWPNSLLFKRLNGTSNGDIAGSGRNTYFNANTDIFVDSKEYDYLKSGDKINGGNEESIWYKLIDKHTWLHGETKEFAKLRKCDANLMYKIESGNEDTWHTKFVDEQVVSEKYRWTENIDSKISLMYFHDFFYSYYDGINENSRGNAGTEDNLTNSWIYFKNNSLNKLGGVNTFEWSMVGTGEGDFGGYDPETEGWEGHIWPSGLWSALSLADFETSGYIIAKSGVYGDFGIRPVFYINNNITLSGNGLKETPYLINFE